MDSGFLTDHVSTALQAILARKEEEKRQALLDSITKQNADTNRMQAESNEQWRKGQAAREQATADKEWMNDMAEGQDLNADDVSRLQRINQGGAIKSTPSGDIDPFTKREDGSIDEGPVQVMKNTYAGSPQERQASSQREALTNLLKNDPEFTKRPEMEQFLTLRNLGINVKPADLRSPEDEKIPLVWVNRQGKPEVRGTFKKGTHFVNEPAPPGQGGSESFALVDDDNDPTTPPLAFGNKSRALYPLVGKDGAEVPKSLRKVGSTTPQPPIQKPKLWQQGLPAVRKAVETRAKAKGLKADQQAMLNTNVVAARAAVIGAYEGENLTPEFKQQLVAISRNPKFEGVPVTSIIAGLNSARAGKGLPPLADNEIAAMNELLPPLLGN